MVDTRLYKYTYVYLGAGYRVRITLFEYSSSLTSFSTSYFALINGGISGLVWGYLATSIAMGFVVASLAEIASMSVLANS